MKSLYYTATSIDGFIADPADGLEWLLQFGGQDEQEASNDYQEFIAGIGVLAMGSATYEWILRHLVEPGEGQPGSWPYEQPCWVFSSRDLPKLDGPDIRFVRGDVRPVYDEMAAAAGGKNLWVVGGGELAGQFHDQGLLDELILFVAPVTLGAGKPLFTRRIATPPLALISASTQGPFIRAHYEIVREQG